MALFVAKLFADTSPVVRDQSEPVAVVDETGDRESPPLVSIARKSHRISHQSMSRKLVRMYTKNNQRQIRENIEKARLNMNVFDPSVERTQIRRTDSSSGLWKLAEPRIDFDPSHMHLVEYVGKSLREMENGRAQMEADAAAQRAADERLRVEMEDQVAKFFSNTQRLEKICENLTHIANDVASDVFEKHRNDMKKAEFVDGVVRCLRLTSQARRNGEDSEHVAKRLNETRKILMRFEELGLHKSQSYRVLQARFRIVMNEFANGLVVQLERPETRSEAYRILKNFKHKKYSVERKLLDPWMKKFEYHFTRPGSALNEPDKPEWPLKWFLETGKNLKQEFNDPAVLVELAKLAREYFETHRWALINDPADDAFSLYLSKYLDFALQVRDLMGTTAMTECMKGFTQDAAPTKSGWFLLHEWIRYDRRYFDNVLDGVKDPWNPSKIDPTVNEIVQTLIDMFSACTTRLEPLSGIPEAKREFVAECCDNVVRSHVVHGVRIEIASDIPSEKRPLMVSCLRRLNAVGTETGLVSLQVRKLLSELINELE